MSVTSPSSTACRDGGQLLEGGAGALRDDPHDRRLPGAGRSEEDRGRRPVVLDRASERRAGAEDVLLPHELVQRGWPQTDGERRVLRLALARRLAEEVGHARSMLRPWPRPRISPSRSCRGTPAPTTSGTSTRKSSSPSRRPPTSGCTATSCSSRSRTRPRNSG